MKLIKVRYFVQDNEDASYTKLFHDKKEIIGGDDYHNRIDDYIKGFLQGLLYAGIKYKLEEVQDIVEDEEELYEFMEREIYE